MANTNFKIFNEDNSTDKTYNDSEYSQATQRQSGVIPGMALSRLHNKLYLQVSTMAKAIADFLVNQGFDCYDNKSNEISQNLEKAIKKFTAVDISSSLKAHDESADAHKSQFALYQKVATLGEDIIKKLALTTTITAISSLQENSWFGQLLKMVLTASGVRYSLNANGYVNFGSFFGGVMVQWGDGAVSGASTAVTFPVSFAENCYQVLAGDIGGEAHSLGATGNRTQLVIYNATQKPVSFRYIAIGK